MRVGTVNDDVDEAINLAIEQGDYIVQEKIPLSLWADCLTLENLWLTGELDKFVNIEEEELGIARLNPWGGSTAIIASDGLFDFGAAQEPS